MNERLLQYIWQFQYYNTRELRTVGGDEVVIIRQGTFNAHQGPDFIGARVRIGANVWAGNVELHVHTSDWEKHLHDGDPNYENVILHVAWKDDGGSVVDKLPTLLLEDRVPAMLIKQYEAWMRSVQFVPCENYLSRVNELVWKSWKDRLLFERLYRKSKSIITWLEKNSFHWEETLWWLIARNMGLLVNADAFEEVARSIPYGMLLKNVSQRHLIEALLFGQAGLLEGDNDGAYFNSLQKDYLFLKKKYGLESIHLPLHFLRMRPACFPTVRLAQLAAVVRNIPALIAAILHEDEPANVKVLLDVEAGKFWDHHFTFSEEGVYHPKRLGGTTLNVLMLNAIVPLLFTYGDHRKEDRYCAKALKWMEALRAEKNSVMRKFAERGVVCANAADSQALIELKSQYCDHRRCLDCAIGNAILKR
jgi:hypothetical protein